MDTRGSVMEFREERNPETTVEGSYMPDPEHCQFAIVNQSRRGSIRISPVSFKRV